MKLGKTDFNKAVTPREEYDYLRSKLDDIGDFFSDDVHSCHIDIAKVLYTSVLKKLEGILDSHEFKE